MVRGDWKQAFLLYHNTRFTEKQVARGGGTWVLKRLSRTTGSFPESRICSSRWRQSCSFSVRKRFFHSKLTHPFSRVRSRWFGDDHTVGVASQILEYALRFAEGRLDVNQRSSLHNSRWK